MPQPFSIEVRGPVLVFGGPYSNLEATHAVLNEASARGIPPDHIVCTGDVVAYAADAAATADLMRRSAAHVVMGNCEESLAGSSADCGCGFPEGSACERLAASWYSLAAGQLDAEARSWMAGLPRRIDIRIAGYRLAVVHGGITSINQFIFGSSPAAVKSREIELADTDGIIGGHCGLPFTQTIDGRLWHNPGAIGLPANDGSPRTWFSILAAEPDGLRIEHWPLTYDSATAAGKMRRAGLPEGYADALEVGLWPSCDVLPRAEICARGVPLREAAVTWRGPTPAQRRAGPGRGRVVCETLWPRPDHARTSSLSSGKFKDPQTTASGEPRATVALRKLQTVWFNTGSLCNVTCENCYIESSPKNDRLAYLSSAEVAAYLDEIQRGDFGTEQIAFTGGEPFMNPDFSDMLEDALTRGFEVLVLTNAMRPMQRAKAKLANLNRRFGGKLQLRVSLDHFTREMHEDERGPNTFKPALEGLIWLAQSGIRVTAAGRTIWGEDLAAERQGYRALFAEHGIPIDAQNPAELVLFPEMDSTADIPEITKACWGTLGKSPHDLMCATSRMVVKRKGSERPTVLACTLVAYDKQFELGHAIGDALRPIALNHPHCAQFCVFGGASCTPAASARNQSHHERTG